MIAEFAVVPIGEGEELADLVAGVIDLVDKSGLTYQLTAMGTIVEGEWDEVFDLIKACHVEMRRHAKRVETRVTVDDRERAVGRIRGKVRDVEERLKRPLKK